VLTATIPGCESIAQKREQKGAENLCARGCRMEHFEQKPHELAGSASLRRAAPGAHPPLRATLCFAATLKKFFQETPPLTLTRLGNNKLTWCNPPLT
jgi:hypothetical protein